MGKAARDVSARERIKAEREKERKQQRHRRLLTLLVAGVVAVAVVAGGWWYVQSGRSELATGQLAPITIQSDGSVVMARPGVQKPLIEVYEDFQCPACKAFEQVSSPTLKNLAAEGQAKVVYHPITIFSDEPTRGNSLRAASAARCVPDGKQWMAYHDRLFAGQPSETTPGFKVDDLVKWGEEAGVTAPGFASCVTTQKNAKAQADYSKKVLDSGVITQGTPTLRLDGKEVDNNVAFSPPALRQAVLDAAKPAGNR
ncbi:thioredoxin domain-containing protein [Sphaerisporangium sp. TRM90804]|uniref:DsbA family protein n=1 Tax=Sphaerisporangium sp. TRM90804 TaxID=3031113 RepID=UPI0024485020|nr:thioredoxin domain-containing protein [Sphaerisporangium sp. TRM90804]MDH2428557.1 thioredoxin domain-containing protein [Sphaerisporangium sp. TRM90804]